MPAGGGKRHLHEVPSGYRSVAVLLVSLLVLSASLLGGCIGGGPTGAGDRDAHDPTDEDPSASAGSDDGSTGGEAGAAGDGSDGSGSQGGSGDDGNGNTTHGEGDDEGDDEGSGGSGGEGSGNGSGGGSGGGDDGNGGGGDNDSVDEGPVDPWAGDDPPWPEVADAKVRPGVRVGVGSQHCTSNFLFRSLVNGTLFLGLAAHCVHGVSLGTKVNVYGVDGDHVLRGSVAYSSWRAIGFWPSDGPAGDDVHPHDFALIELPREERELVHPALIHYGGPTGLASWEEVSFADRVFAYGNSGSRPDDQLDPQQGYVVGTHSSTVHGSEGHSILTHMAAPPVPGDSGSPLINQQAEALGVLSAVTVGIPYGAWWEYASLPHALEFVNLYEDWDLELATFEALETPPEL